MSDIIIDTDSGKFKAGDGQDLNLYHNGTNSFVENETGILYVTNKANANMVLGTNNSARLTIESDGTIVTSGAFQPGGNVTAGGNLALSATNTLFFDGNGGHTFITEFAANKMQLQAGGQGSVILDGTNSGTIRMGIGTSSPDTPLHIKGAGDTYVTVEAGASDGNVGFLFDDSGSNQHGFVLYDTDDDIMTFGSANTERMRINSSGNVGIGATPTTFHAALTGVQIGGNGILQHETSAGAGKTFKIAQNVREEITSGYFTYISTDEASLIELSGGGVNIKTAPSGTAGATATMTSRFTVAEDGVTTFGNSLKIPEYIYHDGDTNTHFRMRADEIILTTGGNNCINIGTTEVAINHDQQDIDFRVETTGNTHGFFIDAGNNVVNIQRPIRDNTANSPDEVLALKTFYPDASSDGNAGAGPLLSFYIPDDETYPALGGGVACVKESADDSDMSSSLQFYTSGNDTSITAKMYLNSSGYVGIGGAPSTILHLKGHDPHLRIEDTSGTVKHWNISVGHAADGRLEIDDTEQDNGVYMNQGATSWTSSSDERLKTNWTTFNDALGSINSLTKVGTFQYTKSIEDQTPKNDVVHSGLSAQEVQKFLPNSVSENSDGILGLQYQHLIPVLVKAVQELSAKVEALENA